MFIYQLDSNASYSQQHRGGQIQNIKDFHTMNRGSDHRHTRLVMMRQFLSGFSPFLTKEGKRPITLCLTL